MKAAFTRVWRGEHVAGPQDVLPRSLIRLVARLNGRADAAWAMACATKKIVESVQANAPTITERVTVTGNRTA